MRRRSLVCSCVIDLQPVLARDHPAVSVSSDCQLSIRSSERRARRSPAARWRYRSPVDVNIERRGKRGTVETSAARHPTPLSASGARPSRLRQFLSMTNVSHAQVDYRNHFVDFCAGTTTNRDYDDPTTDKQVTAAGRFRTIARMAPSSESVVNR